MRPSLPPSAAGGGDVVKNKTSRQDKPSRQAGSRARGTRRVPPKELGRRTDADLLFAPDLFWSLAFSTRLAWGLGGGCSLNGLYSSMHCVGMFN